MNSDSNDALDQPTNDRDVIAEVGDLVGYKEAAAILGIPVGTAYALVHQRRVPHVRLGRRNVKFSRRALAHWIARCSVQPSE